MLSAEGLWHSNEHGRASLLRTVPIELLGKHFQRVLPDSIYSRFLGAVLWDWNLWLLQLSLLSTLFQRLRKRKKSQVRARWTEQWKMEGREKTKVKKVERNYIYSVAWRPEFQNLLVLFHIILLIEMIIFIEDCMLPFPAPHPNKKFKINVATALKKQSTKYRTYISLVI